ncbi:hypothetical protein DIPPA_31221 [Diplonema papillatum]|nr:hypothetical protein DIPPA_31221 [Diplonema papillatum]
MSFTRLQTAGDLAAFIKGSKAQDPSPRPQRNFPKPGNTAAIPLTISALRRKDREDAVAQNPDEYYVPRAGGSGVPPPPRNRSRARAAGRLFESDHARPEQIRQARENSLTRSGGGSRSGSAGARSTRSTRSAVSRGSRLSALAEPKKPAATGLRPFQVGVSPMVSSRFVDPQALQKRKARGGYGTGLSSDAVNKVASVYR